MSIGRSLILGHNTDASSFAKVKSAAHGRKNFFLRGSALVQLLATQLPPDVNATRLKSILSFGLAMLMLALYSTRFRNLKPPLTWMYPAAIVLLCGFGIWHWKHRDDN